MLVEFINEKEKQEWLALNYLKPIQNKTILIEDQYLFIKNNNIFNVEEMIHPNGDAVYGLLDIRDCFGKCFAVRKERFINCENKIKAKLLLEKS
jgi:hypothetical protein